MEPTEEPAAYGGQAQGKYGIQPAEDTVERPLNEEAAGKKKKKKNAEDGKEKQMNRTKERRTRRKEPPASHPEKNHASYAVHGRATRPTRRRSPHPSIPAVQQCRAALAWFGRPVSGVDESADDRFEGKERGPQMAPWPILGAPAAPRLFALPFRPVYLTAPSQPSAPGATYTTSRHGQGEKRVSHASPFAQTASQSTPFWWPGVADSSGMACGQREPARYGIFQRRHKFSIHGGDEKLHGGHDMRVQKERQVHKQLWRMGQTQTCEIQHQTRMNFHRRRDGT